MPCLLRAVCITADLEIRQGPPGTTALRSVGLSVRDKGGKKLGPTSEHANNPRSGTEMMEGIVHTLKQAYSPGLVNVATWDAALKLDTMQCCGLLEYGTAKSTNGLEYRFAVFRGAGQMHWTGERWMACGMFCASPLMGQYLRQRSTPNRPLCFGSHKTLASALTFFVRQPVDTRSLASREGDRISAKLKNSLSCVVGRNYHRTIRLSSAIAGTIHLPCLQ